MPIMMRRSSEQSKHTWLIFITFALLVVAIIAIHGHHYGGREYIEDEAWWVHALLARSFSERLIWIAGDTHVPLSFMAFGSWLDLFGHHEIMLRALNQFAVAIGMALLFRLSADLFDRRVGLLAVFLLGITPLFVFYANEVRPYGILTAVAIGAQLAFIRWLRRPTFRRAVVFVLFGVATIHTHYIGFILIGALFIYFIVFARRHYLRGLGLFVAIGLSFLGWLPVLLQAIFFTTPGGSVVAMPIDRPWAQELLWDWLRMRPADLGVLLMLVGLLIPYKTLYPGQTSNPAPPLRFNPGWRKAYIVAIPALILLLSALLNPALGMVTPRNMIIMLPSISLLGALGMRALPWQAVAAILLLMGWPGVTTFRLFQETGTYHQAVAYMNESNQPGSRLVIDAKGAIATMPLTYYLRERIAQPRLNAEVFNLTQLPLAERRKFPDPPVNLALDDSPETLRQFEAFLTTDQVWYATLNGHPTRFNTRFLEILNERYIPFRMQEFERHDGRQGVIMVDYRRIPDDLADMFILNDTIHLQKWTLREDVTAQPCQPVTLDSWWVAASALNDNYNMTLVLADANGVGIAQNDSEPANTLTAQWAANRPYLDTRQVTIPCDAEPGEYPLLLGWYDLDNPGEALPVTLPDGSPLDGLIYLTTLIIP